MTDALVHLGNTSCDRRIWIKANRAAAPKEPGALKVVLATRGIDHEERQAEQEFPDCLDLGGVGPLD